MLGLENFFAQRIWVPKNFWIWKNLGSKKIKALKNLSGQNQVSNSCDIPDMDKWCQDKWFLDKCHCDSWYLLKMVRGTYL